MRDGPLRAGIKFIAMARYAVDLGFTRWVRRLSERPMFNLGGSCTGCGACCETPMVQVHPVVFHLPTVRAVMIWWHRAVNRLEFIRWDREASSMVFRCLHLDLRTRRCDAYATRPGMCRDYPRALLGAADPSFIPGCGHYAVSRQSARMRATLADVELSDEARERLEERLHARE